MEFYLRPGGSTPVNAVLTRVTISQNGNSSKGAGLAVNGASSTGALKVTLAESIAAANYSGLNAGSSAVLVRNSTISNNIFGIFAAQAASITVGQSTLTGNLTALQTTGGGVLNDYGNNNLIGNAANGVVTSLVTLQ
jgi:hypothetical protein